MKVALVHDYIKEYGGAERVLEALHETWPSAPVFTTVFLPEFLGPHSKRFKDWDIRTSWLQDIPFVGKLISPVRLIAPFIFRNFDFSGFDVIIVSATGAYNPNMMQKKSALQICYCHTPPRYLYGYATARVWKNNLIFRVLGEIANHFLRLVDFKSSQNVDFFIANSLNIKKRIEKFYRRDSVVIYPPVGFARSQPHVSDDALLSDSKSLSSSASLSKSRLQTNLQPTFNSSESGLLPRSYYLAGGRIARPKHIDLIIKTFEKLELPLKVFGRGFAGADLKSKSPKIEFIGEVSDEEKLELMARAKAFVFAAEDEDFGITPVEAMSVGTAVIAYRSGGVLESVLENKTGLFFDELSIESLAKVVRGFEKMKFDKESIVKHAQKFNKERFKKEIKEFIESRVKNVKKT